MKNELLSKVFFNLFIGLLVTFGVGYLVSVSSLAQVFVYNPIMMFMLIIAELAIAIILPVRINKMNSGTARILYILYAALTGLTFSSIFIVYELTSILWVFLVTSIMFGVFAFVGKTTKMDLSKIGTYLLIGLFSIILLSLINIFIRSVKLDLTLCILGIVIFLGYIAYDIQRILKLDSYGMDEDSLAVIGAFNLYLDFINLFIKLLRIFGKERD